MKDAMTFQNQQKRGGSRLAVLSCVIPRAQHIPDDYSN